MTEIHIASASAVLAILTYIFLRKLTLDTTTHRNERLNKQKMKKARKIQAEKDEIIKRYESWFPSEVFDWTAPMTRKPSMKRSCSHEPRLNSISKSDLNMPVYFGIQKNTSLSTMNVASPHENNRFNFEPHYIANFLNRQESGNDGVFSGSKTDTPFSPGENYKDWSLRRRDVQVMLLDQ